MEEYSKELIESDIKTLIQQEVWVESFSESVMWGLGILFLGVIGLILGIVLMYFPSISFIFTLLAPPVMFLGVLLASLAEISKIIASKVYNHKLEVLRSKEGEDVVVDSVISICKGENHSKYTTAINILGDIGNKRATQFILLSLKNENSEVRQKAAEALGKIGDKKAIDALVQALKDENKWWVSSEVAGALDKLGWIPSSKSERAYYLIAKKEWDEISNIGNSAIEPLIQALKDEDRDVRERSACILGEMGNVRAVEPLIQTLKDEHQDVLIATAEALKKIGKPAVEPLIQALTDGNNNVQWGAAEILGAIGDERAVEPLIQALTDGNNNVQNAAKEALEKIKMEKS